MTPTLTPLLPLLQVCSIGQPHYNTILTAIPMTPWGFIPLPAILAVLGHQVG